MARSRQQHCLFIGIIPQKMAEALYTEDSAAEKAASAQLAAGIADACASVGSWTNSDAHQWRKRVCIFESRRNADSTKRAWLAAIAKHGCDAAAVEYARVLTDVDTVTHAARYVDKSFGDDFQLNLERMQNLLPASVVSPTCTGPQIGRKRYKVAIIAVDRNIKRLCNAGSTKTCRATPSPYKKATDHKSWKWT